MKHFSGLPQAFNKEHFPPLFWLWIISGMKITEAEGGGGRSDPLSTTRHFQHPLVPFPLSSVFFLLERLLRMEGSLHQQSKAWAAAGAISLCTL